MEIILSSLRDAVSVARYRGHCTVENSILSVYKYVCSGGKCLYALEGCHQKACQVRQTSEGSSRSPETENSRKFQRILLDQGHQGTHLPSWLCPGGRGREDPPDQHGDHQTQAPRVTAQVDGNIKV